MAGAIEFGVLGGGMGGHNSGFSRAPSRVGKIPAISSALTVAADLSLNSKHTPTARQRRRAINRQAFATGLGLPAPILSGRQPQATCALPVPGPVPRPATSASILISRRFADVDAHAIQLCILFLQKKLALSHAAED